VFQALDVASGLDVIAKVGLRHGAELPDGRDGAFFVGNEAVMYQRMRERGLGTRLPGFIAFACEDDASILILEKLDGDNLWTGRKNLSSDPEWIRQAIDAMQAVHRTGFVLGDAKLTNFVVSGSSLRIIDLESCQDLKADRVELMPASFRIVGIAGLDHFEVDLMHFLASVLFVEEQHGSLLADRTIDLAEVMNRAAPRDPWDELAMETIRRMMERHGSLSAVARCDLTCPDELNQ
jgi:serine/threonine protein kinase